MISLPAGISMSDVRQWLWGGWFLFREHEGEPLQPGRLGHDDHDDPEYDDEPRYVIYDIRGNGVPVRRRLTYPHWPICGSLNLDGYAVYLARRQLRQYRRTYNDECLNVEFPRKWDVLKRIGHKVNSICPYSVEVIKAAFNPKYYTYSEAVQMMDTGQACSVALNPQLIVAGPLVYHRNKLIANIEGDKIVPMTPDRRRVSRIVKFFEGRVRL